MAGLEGWTLTLLVVFVFILLWVQWSWRLPTSPRVRPKPTQRPLKPRTPDDCPECRAARPSRSPTATLPKPYSQVKNPRGRIKRIVTVGYACPNSDCLYYGITDDQVHALVGCGGHPVVCPARPGGRVRAGNRRASGGRQEYIRDLKCQACGTKFSVRYGTVLYRLKTPARRVAEVLGALAEGVSVGAATRIFGHREFTVRTWLTRAGLQATTLHEHVLRHLKLLQVQLDEICTKTRQRAESLWVWIALDAPTKLIPVLILGSRTQSTAHAVVHELIKVLAPTPLPAFTSDGLKYYFYALTAHFGDWVTPVGQRARQWQLCPSLVYGQLIKRYRRRRLVRVERHAVLGELPQLTAALRAAGPSGRIQTAFIERLNLTVRQAVAALARRTWGLAQSPAELLLHLQWWRAYYHFTRPHTSLSIQYSERSHPAQRRRFRTPAQAAGLTDHPWTILELLLFPLPKTAE